MSTQTADRTQGLDGAGRRLIPVGAAATLLGRSVWTLKRLHADGDLPVIIVRRRWFVPESFIDMVFASMRPGHAADVSEVAKAWFTANSAAGEVAS